MGLEGQTGSIEIKNVKELQGDATAWGPYARFEHDTLDSSYFPYQGVKWDVKMGYSHVNLDGDGFQASRSEGWDYRLSMVKPWSWDRHSLNLILDVNTCGAGFDHFANGAAWIAPRGVGVHKEWEVCRARDAAHVRQHIRQLRQSDVRHAVAGVGHACAGKI